MYPFLDSTRHHNTNAFSGNHIPEHIGSFQNLRYLNLSGLDFVGGIPYELGNLSKLEYLDLSGNCFDGTIPSQLGKLTSLKYLDLSDNHYFDGEIPYQLGNLSQLRYLDLEETSLSGTIPYQIGNLSLLRYLDLDQTSLSGAIPFQSGSNFSTSLSILDLSDNMLTSSTFQLFNLHSLDLSENLLEAPIPDEFGKVMNSLEVLFLDSNTLHSEIPAFLGNICTLQELHMDNSGLCGEISTFTQNSSWCNRHVFQILSLPNNRITGVLPDLSIFTSLRFLDLSNNQLTGEIPKSIGLLCELQYLHLDGNYLEGDIIGSHLTNLSKLEDLHFSDNSLSLKFGTTWLPPFQIFNLGLASCNLGSSFPSWLQTQLNGSDAGIDDFECVLLNPENLVKSIDLSSNDLTGEVPKEVGYLRGLVSLNLSRNNLNGEIPPGIGNLNSLDFLDLSRNHLSGKIPSTLSKIDGLGKLDLSNNDLSGKIPWEGHLQTFDASSFEENADLCGEPLNKSCPGDDIMLKPQRPTGDDSVFYEALYMSMGLGFFAGFWGLLGSLLLWQPWRIAYVRFLNRLTDNTFVMIGVNIGKVP
ncbi:hypothetical protein VNO78_32942 [Psophocarpus tetragonolobus]|uniref:Uncharacterized protein n=1 Tax=Psophocarpus tetragonolobus TaxID=3891 RepID=A0AAN9RQD1_PSOTE